MEEKESPKLTMEKTAQTNSGKIKKKQKKSSGDANNIVQFFEIVFVFLLVFLTISGEFQFLNIHVFHATVGWVFNMVQGLLVFRAINPIFRKILGKDQVFIHWVLETIALIGATLSFACAYKDKEDKSKPHFITWHGILGLTGYLLCLLAGLNGVPALYRKELKNFISPKWNKFVHIVTGTLGFFFGGLSLIMACYSNWFAKRTSFSYVSFLIALILIVSVVIWTLIRPLDKVRSNWIKLTSKER